jgi:hypothetical protein
MVRILATVPRSTPGESPEVASQRSRFAAAGGLLVVLASSLLASCVSQGAEAASAGVAAAAAKAVLPAVGPAEGTALPSFNESPGCGGLEGVRGPYATVAGDLTDTEAVGGPWGGFFGRTLAEVQDQLVEVEMPMPAPGLPPFTVYVHRRVLPALQEAIDNLEAEQARGNYYIIHRYETFSYNPATIPPDRYLSFHAVGAAIDINTLSNPYRADNRLITDMPDWFVRAWTDAGWCWGGEWQNIKDPMHFSWQGPLYAASYTVEAPMEPHTEAASFQRHLTFDTALGEAPAGSTLLLSDVDRDGAPDAVRVTGWEPTGTLGVEAALAAHGYETCWTAGPASSPPRGKATLLLADGTGQGRPDLWEIDTAGPRVAITIHTFASGYALRRPPLTTGVPSTAGSTFLVGDHDRDGTSDLYVVRPGSPATLEIWRGPDFGTEHLRVDLPVGIDEPWQFALGDRDLDGTPDLYALSPDNPARLVIIPGAADFQGPPLPSPATAIDGGAGVFQTGDLDGDGRDDLYILGPDGTLAVYLGGERGNTPDADLIYWFFEGHNPHWDYGDGCTIETRPTL